MLTILCLIRFKGKIIKTIQKSNNTERTIKYKERNPFLFIKVIPQKLKLPMIFFKTFLECFLPSAVSKNAIKMLSRHARLRDVTGQSFSIYACTRANLVRYSSVQVIF